MSGPRTDTWPRLHRLVEEYTPDGWLGRLLLGAISGSVSAFALLMTLFVLTNVSFATLLSPLIAALALGSGLVAVITLWPVYLSLIGNVESAADYGERERPAPEWLGEETEEGDDPEAILKRRYAAGEISEDEFERRLDALLGAEERERRRDRGDAAEQRERTLERE